MPSAFLQWLYADAADVPQTGYEVSRNSDPMSPKFTRPRNSASGSIVCLAKVHRCRGCKSHPATLAPAGSTRGGSGGDEWSEALREKVPSGDQRVIRAAAQANTNKASKGLM